MKIVDGKECNNNITRFNDLLKREELMRKVLEEVNKGKRSYTNTFFIKEEITYSVLLRDLLAFCDFRGKKGGSRYYETEDGYVINGMYLKEYGEYLKRYNHYRDSNNSTIRDLKDKEKKVMVGFKKFIIFI